MKYVVYTSLFISLMAFIRASRLASAVNRKYRYKYKLTVLDNILRIADSLLRCMIPGLNVVILFVTMEMLIERIKSDEDYELRG